MRRTELSRWYTIGVSFSSPFKPFTKERIARGCSQARTLPATHGRRKLASASTSLALTPSGQLTRQCRTMSYFILAPYFQRAPSATRSAASDLSPGHWPIECWSLHRSKAFPEMDAAADQAPIRPRQSHLRTPGLRRWASSGICKLGIKRAHVTPTS